MPRRGLRGFFAAGWVAGLASFLLAACTTEVPEGSLLLPRGSPISVRIVEAISPASHGPGATFRAELDGPISRDSVIFAPDGAAVEGIVEEINDEPAGPEVAVRLIRLSLENGTEIGLETDPVLRSAKSGGGTRAESPAASMTGLEGLEEKIRYLAETGGPPESEPDPAGGSEAAAVIPADARMVFTLASDVILPGPR